MAFDSAPSSSARERQCEECGYDLHGMPTGGACPECGTPIGAAGTSSGTRWRRAVAVGLLLLLWCSIRGIESVLVQPFAGKVGGVLPLLNMPGPKLWAEPLLQRPIGNAPDIPGISGTRTALLSLFAVWLITIRPPAHEEESSSTLRIATRWVSLVPFGFFFGVLLASQGLWPEKLMPYRLCMLLFSELPAAGLVYAYLTALARTVPGGERRRLFERLRWAVPSVIAIGTALAAAVWYLDIKYDGQFAYQFSLVVFGAYGIIAVLCAMTASVAVASLMIAFAAAGFPDGIRLLSGVRRDVIAVWQAAQVFDSVRLHRRAVAAGLILFVVVAVIGNDQILWYDTRAGLAGNLPYFNFPGPKLWVAAAVPQLGHRYDWQPILSHTTLAVLNLASVWLMTVRLRSDGRDEIFRKVARYGSFAAMGIALGCAGGWRGGRSEELGYAFRSEYFAGVMLLCEVPATILLYLYAAQIAGTTAKRPKLSTQLVLIGVLIPVFAGLAMIAFSLSSEHRTERFTFSALAACGAAGAAAFIGAAWAVVLLLSLAGSLASDARRTNSRGDVQDLPLPVIVADADHGEISNDIAAP